MSQKSETKTNNGTGSGSSPSACSLPMKYIPFGDEWRGFVMKFRKADLVEMLRKSLMGEQMMKSELENIASASMAKWQMNSDEFLSEFQAWSQNRARHAISKANEERTPIR